MSMFFDVPVSHITDAGDNIRFETGDVSELAASIERHGLIEPLVVSPGENLTWTLVCGHRRLAACKALGLDEVPVVVREIEDASQRIELMLIENLHRASISAIEEARAYVRLLEQGLDQHDIAAKVGRSQGHVSTCLKALELPQDLQDRIHAGELSVWKAVESYRKAYGARGKPAPIMPAVGRASQTSGQITAAQILIRAIEHEHLDWDDEHLAERLLHLRRLLGNSKLDLTRKPCSGCGTSRGYIAACCSDHPQRLCSKCSDDLHPEEVVA